MALATYGAKMEEERVKFFTQRAKELNLTGAEFLESLYAAWQLEQDRKTLGVVPELDSLKHHLGRIEEIYVAMARHKADIQNVCDAELAVFKGQLGEKVMEISKLRSDAKQQVDAANEIAVKAEEQVQRIQQEADNEVIQARLAVESAEETRQQAIKLAEVSEQLAKSAMDRAAELENKVKEVDVLQANLELSEKRQAELEKLLAETQAQVEQDRRYHISQVADIQEKSANAIEKAVLAARAEGLDKLETALLSIDRLREQLTQVQVLQAPLPRLPGAKPVK